MPCDYRLLPHKGIQSLHPYIPGKSSEELAKEKGLTDIIKLASNENPLGCSLKVKEMISKMTVHQLATYPAPAKHHLRQKMAAKLGIQESMIMFSNGSDALFTLLLTIFGLNPNKHMLTHQYSFITFSIQANTLDIPIVSIPVNDQYEVDIDGMIKACNQDTAIIFLANPNNPTGRLIPLEEIKRLLNNIPETTIVVLDEAYYEFAYPRGDKASLNLLQHYPNLVITRTFSKIYGLAALRIGYAIANPVIIELILKVQLPFAVSQVALEAASVAIDDIDFVTQTLIMNSQGMQQMQKGLQDLKLDQIPSSGNFITFDCGFDGQILYKALQEKGIIVRPLAAYGLNQHLRVTIGTIQQNVRFLSALATCLQEQKKELAHEK